MYIEQKEPDKEATLKNGAIVTPLVTLKDEYGGVSHIIEDDHCYVLINRGFTDVVHAYSMSYHWYNEAVYALIRLVEKNQNPTAYEQPAEP
jgi:hypothetical protein